MREFRSAMWFWGRRVALFSAPAITLSAIAEEVGERESLRLDSLLLGAGHFHLEPLVITLAVFSLLGGGVGMIVLTALPTGFLAMRRRYGAAFFLVAALIGAEAINRVFKEVFGRARPEVPAYQFANGMRAVLYGCVAIALMYAWTSRWRLVAIYASGVFVMLLALDGFVSTAIRLTPGLDSFPSGHAVGSMALVAAGVRLTWRTRHRWNAVAAGGIFVVIVGVSRVYLGYHYVSDVMAGWCLSLAWVVLLSVMLGRVIDREETVELAPAPWTGSLV